MTRRPTVHLLCGLPGSGKTTLARRLVDDQGGVRFTLDEWMIRLFGLAYDDPSYAGLAERCQALIADTALDVLASGTDVVLDWNQWSRERRRRWRDWAEAACADARLHVLTTTVDQAIERLRQRAADPTAVAVHPVDADGVRHLAGLLEPPSPDEGIPITVDG